MNEKLKINEIFYSVQGEGANVGMPAVFVRFSGCNMDCPFCDTKHDDYFEMTVSELIAEIEKYHCRNIIWTGGEPTLQLTYQILQSFTDYNNCIETNGTKEVPAAIDYIVCSPKIDTRILNKNFSFIDEFRYPIKVGDKLPDIDSLPAAHHYYVSPIDVSKENIDYCLTLVKDNPQWKMSVQIHKLLQIK